MHSATPGVASRCHDRDVSIFAALIAGLVSFLSPCVLPLVPPYLVYLAGTSIERLANTKRDPQLRRATVIAARPVRGGIFDRVRGARRQRQRDRRDCCGSIRTSSSIVAGVAIIVMGLHFLGITPIALAAPAGADGNRPSRSGYWGAYVMGLAFALGWTPCIGPILAAILAVAASEATVAKGAALLAIYSLGLGVPFILAAFAVEPFAKLLARFRGHLAHVERAMGGLLVLTGIAFLFGFFTQLNGWLLEAFPALQTLG